jgi:hypothetical protein
MREWEREQADKISKLERQQIIYQNWLIERERMWDANAKQATLR